MIITSKVPEAAVNDSVSLLLQEGRIRTGNRQL